MAERTKRRNLVGAPYTLADAGPNLPVAPTRDMPWTLGPGNRRLHVSDETNPGVGVAPNTSRVSTSPAVMCRVNETCVIAAPCLCEDCYFSEDGLSEPDSLISVEGVDEEDEQAGQRAATRLRSLKASCYMSDRCRIRLPIPTEELKIFKSKNRTFACVLKLDETEKDFWTEMR